MPEDPVDVVIVGAGASAAVAARRLSEGGLSVTCLEQGDWPDRGSYRGASADWELTSRKQWTGDPNVRAAPGDYPVDCSESDMSVGMFNGVGGGTILFNAVWPRLTPADFQVASLDGVADDWPLRYDDLLPYYEATDRQFGVSGLGGNPVYPGDENPPCPPLPIGRGGLLVARAHARLGWNWWPDTNAIASIGYQGRNPCVQRGTCPQGCAEGAKGSVDVTHWPAAVANGARLVTGARARRVIVNRAGRASGVEWTDRAGNQHHQPAEVVLLAANGIGTPRLLLASATAQQPDGLANSSGLVGRRLMLHPLVRVNGWFAEPLESWQGHNGSAIGCWEFYRSDPSRGFVRGSKWSLHPGGGPLRVACPPDGPGVWGAAHHDHVAARFGRTVSWIMLCEDLPEEHNRIQLSQRTDGAGLPVPAVRYRLSENSRRMMAWQAQRAEESLREAGAVGVETIMARANSHLLGTARMGDDPATSVVDRWGMSHDVPNLGIIDGSVFVTAGAVNPTSTIAALALRAADHLLATGPAPERRKRPVHPPAQRTSPAPAPLGPAIRTRYERPLGREQRDRFVAIADVLIPGRQDRPSPSDLALGDAPLDAVLAARPDLLAPLEEALQRFPTPRHLADDPDQLLAQVAEPGLRSAVLVAVAGAYYLTPEVRRAIGYPGQQPREIHPFTIPDYLEEGLLDHVSR